MFKIRAIQTNDNCYAVAVLRDDGVRLATGCGFDEAMGVIAAAMLRPDSIPHVRRPEWRGEDAHFGMTHDQYEELIA